MNIFVASSGRCGTGYLSKGFERFTNISAFHEQAPVLFGDLSDQANHLAMDSVFLDIKAQNIAKHSFYIDTAHQFMRGFYRYALKHMPNLKVIKLARDPLEVARSRIHRQVVPGRTPWLGKFDDELNIIKLTDEEWNSLTDLQKILLDWIEHEQRFHETKDQFAQIVYVTFEALTLNTGNTFKRIFKELGIVNFNIDTVDLYRNANSKASIIQPGDQEEFDALVSLIASKDIDLSWMETDFYQRVIRRHNIYDREINLLDHYNKHVDYTSVNPEWGFKQLPIQIDSSMRILDLGCGDGRWSRFIKHTYGCHVTGVDFSVNRIEKARSLSTNIEYYCDNAYDFVTNYKGPKFDYCILTETIEHLEHPEKLLNDLQGISNGLMGTVPKNFPFLSHLQVFKSAKEFRERFPEWNLKTKMGSMAANDNTKSTIYFYT